MVGLVWRTGLFQGLRRRDSLRIRIRCAEVESGLQTVKVPSNINASIKAPSVRHRKRLRLGKRARRVGLALCVAIWDFRAK